MTMVHAINSRTSDALRVRPGAARVDVCKVLADAPDREAAYHSEGHALAPAINCVSGCPLPVHHAVNGYPV